jgi:steroid 5-alpha reductase family enzyme
MRDVWFMHSCIVCSQSIYKQAVVFFLACIYVFRVQTIHLYIITCGINSAARRRSRVLDTPKIDENDFQ